MKLSEMGWDGMRWDVVRSRLICSWMAQEEVGFGWIRMDQEAWSGK